MSDVYCISHLGNRYSLPGTVYEAHCLVRLQTALDCFSDHEPKVGFL